MNYMHYRLYHMLGMEIGIVCKFLGTCSRGIGIRMCISG